MLLLSFLQCHLAPPYDKITRVTLVATAFDLSLSLVQGSDYQNISFGSGLRNSKSSITSTNTNDSVSLPPSSSGSPATQYSIHIPGQDHAVPYMAVALSGTYPGLTSTRVVVISNNVPVSVPVEWKFFEVREERIYIRYRFRVCKYMHCQLTIIIGVMMVRWHI